MLTPLNRVSRVTLLPLCGLGMLGLAPAPARSQSLALNGSATATINQLGTTTTGTHTFSGGANGTTSSYSFVNLFDTSKLTVGSGASITSLNAFDSSSVTVTGGNITNLSTGVIQIGGSTSVLAAGGGSLAISGGNFGTVSAFNDASLSVSGGIFGSLTTADYGNATTTISGGTINTLIPLSATQITGGDIGILDLRSAILQPIDIYGRNFVLTPDLPGFSSVLTGTLADGEGIDALVPGPTQMLRLHDAAVPEASQSLSFGLMLALGLGGLVIAARRKSRGGKAGA